MISPLNLSQFEVVKKVGQGGFGKVFEVKDKTSGQIFAAKVALFSLESESKDTIRNLAREVNIISKLNHPSIVKFIGYSPLNFKGKPNPVIITEFLTNGSLGDILNLERKGLCDLGWNETRKIINIFGIATAMSYLHSNNIIHRDLKPDNILMDEYLLPRLTDFGLSKVKHTNDESMSLQSTATLKGTPIYIAPEIWATYEYTKEGDVYAFAFIIYEIITLEEPHKNCDYFSLMTNVLNGIMPEIVSIPECYKNLIEKCWDQNPSNRPTFDQIVSELKNNEEFITDLVEEDDYIQYIEYIEKYKTSFDSKNHINITDFINHETKTFQKIEIDKELINKMKNDEDDNIDDYDDDDESSTSNSEKNPKNDKNKKLFDINIKKKELPFELPPDDNDPILTKNRELLYKKLITLPKETIPQAIFTYACLTQYGKFFPKNDKEASLFYKIAADLGHVDAMWYYAISLEKGQGIEVNTKEADRYFEMAIEKGSVNAMSTYAAHLVKRKSASDQKKGVYYYKMAVKEGDTVSMHDLGCLYLEGIAVEKDLSKALKYHKLAAKKGYTKSLLNIGYIYKNGEGVPVDLEKAFSYFKLAASNGNAEAMNSVGYMYEKGNGTTKNITKALKYYNDAIAKGNTNAMVNVGAMLVKSDDEEKIKQAYQFFKQAADLNNTNALINLHYMYDQGIGVPMNKEESLKCLQKGIDLGDTMAMRGMAEHYKEGDGVKVDLKKAFSYFKLAASNGDAEAINTIGLMYENGEGTEKNINKAIKCYNDAIEKGNSNAMVNLGSMLIKTNEEEKMKQAFELFKKAADLDNAKALLYLHVMYNQGNGIPMNKEEGLKCLQKGIKLGDSAAMRTMGAHYVNGDGVPVDLKKGHKYFLMAADHGSTDDMYLVGLDYLKGDGVDRNPEEAAKYFKKGADLNNDTCMITYADMLYDGDGVPKNEEESIRYYSMAKDKGNKVAWERLGTIFLEKDPNSKEGIEYLIKSASLGNVDSMNKLAEYYQNNNERPQEDFDKSLYFSILAYSNGNKNAMLYIYNLVLKKKIHESKIEDTINFVKGAANLGDTNAMVVYVTYLTNNCEPTPEILSEQVHYAKLAADNGNSQGMVCYGILLEMGHGIEKNVEEAMHYYKMAADLGNVTGQMFYNRLVNMSNALGNAVRSTLKMIQDTLQTMVELNKIAKSCENAKNNNNANNIPVNKTNTDNLNDDSISSSLSSVSNDEPLDRNITVKKNINVYNQNADSKKNMKFSQKHPVCICMLITFIVMCCIAVAIFVIYKFVFF